ncbi:Imm27 family immunity protein [Sphingobacterium sp. LRF_L2]|uniref:Imm27 family immunity protein n=1 Tax=Sphingobacterium sp. LRF_L2 TaxID=3369421 RepID=UPI003F630A8B
MIAIKSNEFKLIGGTKFVNSAIEFDDVSERIFFLINNYLREIASDDSGWIRLFQDPKDLRYWELSYPDNEIAGAGAPVLKNIANDLVRKRYKL